jgi:AraC-like DNA-binding protein
VNETATRRSRYREHRPPPAWRHAVARTWEQRIVPDGGVYRQRILPDGHADLVVHDDGLAVVVGPATAVTTADLAAGGTVRGVRLAFDAVHAVLGLPAAELTDRVVPLSALVDAPAAAVLVDAVGVADPAALRAVDRWLAPRRPRPEVTAAVRALWREPDVPDVVAVAGRVGLSARQLRRTLHTEVGLGPKTFQRIGRLHRFLTLATARPGAGLAELAAAAGYADQPHLSRESRALAGLTAAELLAFQRG